MKRLAARKTSVPVLENRAVARATYRLAFEEPVLARSTRPGQFLMLLLPRLRDPLLPRPFAVYRVVGERVEVLYRTVGRGTAILSSVRPSETLDVLGPLGNGFTLPEKGTRPLVVAGGCGLASVAFLLDRLLDRGFAPALFYGVRSAEEIVPVDDLAGRGVEVHTGSEDGKTGDPATAIDLLLRAWAAQGQGREGRQEAFVCGPVPMMRAAADLLSRRAVPAQFSLEARMACGYGVCRGCAIPGAGGPEGGQAPYPKVCVDGPVFRGEEVAWDRMS